MKKKKPMPRYLRGLKSRKKSCWGKTMSWLYIPEKI